MMNSSKSKLQQTLYYDKKKRKKMFALPNKKCAKFETLINNMLFYVCILVTFKGKLIKIKIYPWIVFLLGGINQ